MCGARNMTLNYKIFGSKLFKARKVNKKTDLMFVAREIAKSILLDYAIATLKEIIFISEEYKRDFGLVSIFYQLLLLRGEKERLQQELEKLNAIICSTRINHNS